MQSFEQQMGVIAGVQVNSGRIRHREPLYAPLGRCRMASPVKLSVD